MGAMWVNQYIDGFIASFYLGHIEKSNLRGSIAFTDGMYEEDDPKISAEIIMLMPPYGSDIDVTEDAGISEYRKRKLKPNFDWEKAGGSMLMSAWWAFRLIYRLPTILLGCIRLA